MMAMSDAELSVDNNADVVSVAVMVVNMVILLLTMIWLRL